MSQGGHALALNRYDQVHLYLCSDSDGALSIGIGNRASGLRAGAVSRHRWTLPDGTIALTILDMHGRSPAGEFLAVAAQIDVLIALLKGE